MTEPKYHVRWFIRRDMPEVLEIERGSFDSPWTEDDFIRCLRQRNCIGMVAEHQERVVGYSIYELHKSHLFILNFAVDPYCRYNGIGRAMACKLINKVNGSSRRSRITMQVREGNLDALMFWKAMGFIATEILRDFYADTTEDAYTVEYFAERSAPVT